MTTTKLETIMLPLLKTVGDKEEYSIDEVTERLYEVFNLSEERIRQLPKKQHLKATVSLAIMQLEKAGLLKNTRKNLMRITDKGLDVLRKNLLTIDSKYLEQLQTTKQLQDTPSHPITLNTEIDRIRERFQSCSRVEKAVLRSMKRLYYAGIHMQGKLFSMRRVEEVCRKIEGIETNHGKWFELFRKLERKGLIETVNGDVQIEKKHLLLMVEKDFSPLDNLNKMMGIFSDDSEALFNLSNQAYNNGLFCVDSRARAKYMQIAIKAFKRISMVHSSDRYPIQYAIVRINLGKVYEALAEVEDTVENCRKAIKAYKEALKVYTSESFSIDYATTHTNLGNVYGILARVEDTAKNRQRAIDSYKNALEVYTLEDFPIDYAGVQGSLGVTYRNLSEVEDTVENCRKAIKAYKEALKVYTIDRHPLDYAAAQSNLGVAYVTLAEVEGTRENCGKAIEAYEEVLKVYTLNQYPIEHATTQNNLGNIHATLARVEDKAENCRRAIEAYGETLKVFKKEKFPTFHQSVQSSIREISIFCKDQQGTRVHHAGKTGNLTPG